MPSLLQQYTQKHAPFVLFGLRAFLNDQKKQTAQVSPHLVESIENITEFCLRGGKNMRGVLTVLGYRLARGEKDSIYRIAAAIEMFHKYILSVDDMADRDEKRNGGSTLWKMYQDKFAQQKWADAAHHGRTFAEVDCCLMSSFVTELIRTADFPAEKLLAVLQIVDSEMYLQTIAGWQIHYFQNNQKLAEADEAEYLHGLELVTAHYSFVAPLTIGAVLATPKAGGQARAKQDSDLIKSLTEYGQNVGMAFQLQDDILGMFGDTKETGKPVGNDLREGKKTVLLQRAYCAAKEKDRKFLVKVCGQNFSAADLNRVQKIMIDTGALATTQKMAEDYAEDAIKKLTDLNQKQEEVQVLQGLAQFVVARKK